jgi:hypothetical protein
MYGQVPPNDLTTHNSHPDNVFKDCIYFSSLKLKKNERKYSNSEYSTVFFVLFLLIHLFFDCSVAAM